MTTFAEEDFEVTIDEKRVELLARTLGSLPLAHDFAAQMTPVIEVPDETAFRAYLYAAAVCHATKGGLGGVFFNGYFKGWDFLLRAFSEEALANPGALDPREVLEMSEERLRLLLTDHGKDVEVRLADLDRRAEMLRTTASELLDQFDGSVTRLLDEADNRVDGAEGAYALLSRLSVFRDPLRKKSSAFLMTVHFSGRWKIVDQENILPMIDYHRMRLLLRAGCITVSDRVVADKLRRQVQVHPTVEARIRDAAMQICRSVPVIARMPMFDFDVLLWAHARSCCRHAPLCVSRRVENDSFFSYLAEPPSAKCVFEEWCPGSAQDEVRAFWEPMVATENY
jgi:hypothetical protein